MTDNHSEIIANRIHPFLSARSKELSTNLSCMKGGGPYINERLSKFPCETSQEFSARKSKAFLTNFASRCIHKINQHVLQEQPERIGIDPDFLLDVSKSADQMTLQDFIVEASSYLSALGWCWARVDRSEAMIDKDGLPIDQSKADKVARGDRPYLSLYAPHQVVDWSFSEKTGSLEWLMTEELTTNRPSPFAEYKKLHTRTLWTPYKATRYLIKTQDVTGERTAHLMSTHEHSFNGVPFVLLGKPSPDPIIFDDIERIQAQLLNIESSHSYSLWRSHYSTMILPEGVIRDMTESMDIDYGEAGALIISEGRAIVESEQDKGITRFISPDSTPANTRREEVDAMKVAMMEIFGLFMRRSGSQVESAESKAWDYRDVSAFMSERASVLERFEERILKVCKAIDPLFPEYDPAYNKDFSQVDSETTMRNILSALQLGLPESSEKYLKTVALALIESDSGHRLTSADKKILMDDIEGQESAVIGQMQDLTEGEPS